MKKSVIILYFLAIGSIILLGRILEMDIKTIVICIIVGNILIVSLYIFYRIIDIGGKL